MSYLKILSHNYFFSRRCLFGKLF